MASGRSGRSNSKSTGALAELEVSVHKKESTVLLGKNYLAAVPRLQS